MLWWSLVGRISFRTTIKISHFQFWTLWLCLFALSLVVFRLTSGFISLFKRLLSSGNTMRASIVWSDKVERGHRITRKQSYCRKKNNVTTKLQVLYLWLCHPFESGRSFWKGWRRKKERKKFQNTWSCRCGMKGGVQSWHEKIWHAIWHAGHPATLESWQLIVWGRFLRNRFEEDHQT